MRDFSELSAHVRVFVNESMKKHTTFRIGGPAEALCLVSSPSDVSLCADFCADKDIPMTLIGNGSNLLVRDGGIPGLVIKISDSFGRVDIDSSTQTVVAQAGASVSQVSVQTARLGLCGLEFAGGIPGTLGGAIAMNAGAYGGEMSRIVTRITAMTPERTIITLETAELDFAYRHSRVQTEQLAVLSATLKLSRGDAKESLNKIRQYNEQRREKQPLRDFSAGSTFKRPEGYFAAQIIEQAGLKGRRVGDAEISTLHSGFVINRGNASAADVLGLIDVVKETVLKRFGVELEPEIHIIGKD